MKSHLLVLFSFLMFQFGLNAQVETIAIIGSATANGWDAETPMTKVTDSTWTIDLALVAGEAKFRANNGWDINWGDVAFPSGVGTPGGANIPVYDGNYTIHFNSNSGAYDFDVKSDIGIIGDATVKGWDNDTNMFRDPLDSNKYFIVLNLEAKECKFRQFDAWDISWGFDAFPSGTAVLGGGNIKVAAKGKYRVDFDKSTLEYNFEELADFKSIGIIGSATSGGWDTETMLAKDANNPDLWKGTVTLIEGELKFRANNDWAIDWGGGVFPTDTAVLKGDNIMVDKAGDFLVEFNTKTLIYKFLTIGNYNVVSITGDATPGGWAADTDMVQDATNKSLWNLRVKLVTGEVKFRANNGWDVNWGSGDFPLGVGVQDGANIPAIEGDYKISFNSTTGEYNFVAVVEFDKISLVGKNGPFNEWPGTDDSKDTYMTKDASDGNLWTLKNVKLTNFADVTDGGVKFRANADWGVNWGAKEFPAGTATQGGPNIEPIAGTYNVTFRADTGDYGFAPATATYDILSVDVVGIYPNPTSDYINISLNQEIIKGDVNIGLYDINGAKILSTNVKASESVKLNINGTLKGQYILRLINGQNMVSKVVIIN